MIALVLVVTAACTGGTAGDAGGRSREAGPTADPTTSPASTTAPPSAYGEGWSAVHADGANTDYSPIEPPDDVTARWSIRIPGSMKIGPLPWTINLGPTSDPDGNLYVTSTETGCHLQALDAATGDRRWCAASLDLFTVVSSPLLDRDGNLYVADGSGLHALTAEGSTRWDTPLDGVPLSVQFTPDGHLVFVTHLGTIHVVDRATGADLMEPVALAPELTWTEGRGMAACARGTEACPSANTLAVDAGSGTLYFTFWAPGADQAGLRAYRYRGGRSPSVEALWVNDALPGGTASSPVISGDGTRVYVTDNVDALHAVDAASGRTIWSFPIGYAAGGSPSLSPEGLVMPAGGGASPLLAIRDEGDEGVLAWRRDDLRNRGIATQTAGRKVYATVATADFRCDLVVLDARDGSTLDREPLPGTSVFSVGTTVGADGTVFVPTIVGGLHAFGAPT